LSPKFAKKLVNVNTLSQLAGLVPYRQLNIPDQVLMHNTKLEPMVTVPDKPPSSGQARVFGLPLSQLMGTRGENGIPIVILAAVAFISKQGMETEGVFRRSPSSGQLKEVKRAFDDGVVPDFTKFDAPVHLAAVILKLFLRELPMPLIPVSIYPQLTEQFSTASFVATPKVLSHFLEALPANNLLVLMYVLNFLFELTDDPIRVSKHKMTPANLGIVLSPNLIRCGDPVSEMEVARCTGNFVKSCIEQWKSIPTVSSLPDSNKMDSITIDEGFDWLKRQHRSQQEVNINKAAGNSKAERVSPS
jgi:hypothetical protein